MINIIIGLMNSGKTLDMTQKLFLEYCNGKTIYSNYHLSFPHIRVNQDFLVYIAKKNYVLKNVAMGFDELWIWLDARKSMSDTSILSSYFFLQSSKDDTNIYMTAQDIKQLEMRLRNNSHKISHCSRVLLVNGSFKFIDNEKRVLTEEQQNKLYIKVNEFKRITIGITTDFHHYLTKYIYAKNIYPLYNTFEKVIKNK